MSTPDIIRKLTKELQAGIATEVQVVYLLAGIRKLILPRHNVPSKSRTSQAASKQAAKEFVEV